MKTTTTISILTALALAAATTLVLAQPGDHPGRGAMLEKLKAADTNADGLISREEAAAALPRISAHFDEIDANKDGQVSVDELRAYFAERRADHAKAMFSRMDTDGDGKISKAEALAAAAARFDKADTNKDGFLTPDEIRAAHHPKRAPAN